MNLLSGRARGCGKVWLALLVFVLVGVPGLPRPENNAEAQGTSAGWPAEWLADSAFYNLWSRVDGPLATGAAVRSWLWGPQPFAVANEKYVQSQTGTRLVEYFDKARMEVNDVAASRTSPWFVSSGLLVNEMVTGNVQTGDSSFDKRAPASVPVAGDSGSPDAPTYASFASVTVPAENATRKQVSQRIGKAGDLSPFAIADNGGLFVNKDYDAVSGHNVPAVFADWLKQEGTVLSNGRLAQEELIDPLFVLGRPITEGYWANINVNGTPETVLVQLFERRAITYNPNNAPEWRVEMANVGRAYYDWRYAGSPPAPAISGETAAEGVAVHGWNWPGGARVSAEVDWPADGGKLAGPIEIAADASGKWAATLPYEQPLQSALQSGAVLRVRAAAGALSSMLPLAGKPGASGLRIEGTITLVETTQANTRMSITGLDGKQWRINLSPSAKVTTSEGGAAPITAIDAGLAAVVEGTLNQGVVVADNVRLLSLSATPARINYEWSASGSGLSVAGRGWPGERDVRFTVGRVDETMSQVGIVRTDSRGNLIGDIELPRDISLGSDLWLFASSSDKSGSPAVVGVPLGVLGSASVPPPIRLFATTGQGAQMGASGQYCTRGHCVQSPGFALPPESLTVRAGDVMGLHAQPGTDPLVAPSATRLSVDLFPLAGIDAGQQGNGAIFVLPGGAPIYSTGALPGRPFSVTLLSSLVAGRYVVVVTAAWPDEGGGQNNGVYVFVVQVP